MCLTPILIDNPNYQSPVTDSKFLAVTNTKDTKIPVPCGRCASCIHLKQVYLIQRVQMEALNHDLFYGTLTYNQSSLPIAQYGNIIFAYPDYSDWQKMIKMIRKDYPDLKFKYFLVSEYGGKKHRPHYHFILSLPKTDDRFLALKYSRAQYLFDIFLKYWRRNSGSTRVPVWNPLLTYVRRGRKYNYDLHYLDPTSSKDGLDGVAFYVSKYILKYDDWVEKFKSFLYFNLDHDDYKDAWNKFRPRLLLSKGFGSPYDPDVYNHIRYGIDIALNDNNALFPYYVSRQNGSTYPLCPYFQKRFLSIDDLIVFCSRRPDDTNLSVDDIHKFDVSQNRLRLMKSFLNRQILEMDYDDISDINIELESQLNGNHNQNSSMVEDFTSSWEDF